MARAIVSSGNFLRHARAAEALGAEQIELQIEVGRPFALLCLTATSRTELPCGTHWYGKGAFVSVPKLLAALKAIPDQPITLDLHDRMPCKLYACYIERVDGQADKYTPVTFDL